jgi:uncharacterized membrane protein
MDDANFQLIFNQFPIIILALGLLIMLGGFLFKLEVLVRIAYLTFIMGALSTIPDHSSEIDNAEVISASNNKDHVHAAVVFAMSSYLFGLFSIFGFWASWNQNTISNSLAITCLFLSLVLIFLASYSSVTGSDLRYLEKKEKIANY